MPCRITIEYWDHIFQRAITLGVICADPDSARRQLQNLGYCVRWERMLSADGQRVWRIGR